MLASEPKTTKGGGEQQQANAAAKPALIVKQPSGANSQQTHGCPGTKQAKYDCNTISAIANVRQADAAEWFNHFAIVEVGVGLVTAIVA